MKVNGYSSYVLSNLTNNWISKMQSDMVQAQYESTRGRYFDMSGTLGYKVGRLMDVQMRAENLNFYQNSNKILKHSLDMAQSSLNVLTQNKGKTKGVLQNYLESLLASKDIPNGDIANNSAKTTYEFFKNSINIEFNGRYLFGGTNDAEQPLKDYQPASGEGASKVMQDLLNKFVKDNVKGGDIKNMTQEDMDKFIDGDFSKMFDKGNWEKYFSNAKDEVASNRISENGENIPRGVSFNGEGFKGTMKAIVMIAEFSKMHLPKGALDALKDKAISTLSSHGITKIIDNEAEIGMYQGRIAEVNRRIESQLKVLNDADIALGSVDTAEAASRMTALETSLNIAFQLTGRISKLTLANYI